MKIENIDVEEFLKSSNFVVNRQYSNRLTRKKPSIKRKHIKSERRVELALSEMKAMNKSWYYEIKERFSDSMEKEMTYYRGFSKTGKEVFDEADLLANTLRFKGIEKGDEILACMSNVPEVLTLMLAASKCGAVVNFIGDGFDKDFIRQIVTNNKEKKLFIGTDDLYGEISNIIENSGFKNKVLVSLTDSLVDGIDPYNEYDKDFYSFENKILDYKNYDSSITSYKDYMALGKDYNAKFPKVGLEDEFTITYTSGSTKIGWPKAIVHKNKAYIGIGRFHDPDLSRMPAMRNMRGIAHIPTHSNTNLVSSISDPLCQKCAVAFEPIYNPKFFAYSLIINEAGFVPATRSFWLEAINTFKSDPKLKDKTLPFAINYVAVGEDISKNEIKYIDQGFQMLKAGSEKLPKPLSPITLSVGGGNCEHGGLFFTLFKSLREKISIKPSVRKNYGLTPFQLADIAVLHDDGTECDYEEVGTLVANSPCTMKEYKDNKEATKNFYKADVYGRTWGNCNVYAYIGKNGNVIMKGRKDSEIELSTGKKIPNFLIADTILENDGILSCEVVTVKNEYDQDIAVAHVQLHPLYEHSNSKDVINEVNEICYEKFSEELADRIVFNIHSEKKPFPLTKSGKRSIKDLENEKLDDCIKPYTTYCEGDIIRQDAKEYLDNKMSKYRTPLKTLQKTSKR